MTGHEHTRSRVARLLRFLGTLVLGAALGLVAGLVWYVSRGPRLEPWHLLRPRGELTAARAGEVRDLDGYRRLEDRLFAEVRIRLAGKVRRFPAFSRFDAGSATSPARFDRDWNRTFELEPVGTPRGAALLLHGLSDSPYSLRAVGLLLAAHGFRVVGLRIPGHGAVPGGLAVARRDDWRAAVRIVARDVGAAAQRAGLPFIVVGYSNGSALGLDYTLTALESGGAPVPDRLVFLSPAFAVTPAAALARWAERLSHLPGMGKLAWTDVQPEFDPFKFNSFPVLAGAEIHDLTVEIEEKLDRLGERDPARAGAHGLPPILAIQSVVDATVPPVASLTNLFARVKRQAAGTELLLFDANRSAAMGSLLTPRADELLALGKSGRTVPFRLTLVTNANTRTAAVEELSRAPGELAWRRTPLGLAWPPGIYSLSHVAVPFPPDDPAYGMAASPIGRPFPFGALDLRGERGVLVIPDGLLTRLRCNPFFPVVESKILRFVGAT